MRAAGERQLNLPPFVRGSETSRQAALSVAPKLTEMQAKVLGIFREHYRLTDEELIDLSGLSPSTARPRRVELVDDYGLVEDSGHTKKGRSGRSMTIWRITDAGRGA